MLEKKSGYLDETKTVLVTTIDIIFKEGITDTVAKKQKKT